MPKLRTASNLIGTLWHKSWVKLGWQITSFCWRKENHSDHVLTVMVPMMICLLRVFLLLTWFTWKCKQMQQHLLRNFFHWKRKQPFFFFVTTTVIQEPSQQVKCIHLKRGMSPLLTNPSSRSRPEITICADHSLPYRILIKGKLINEKKKQP